MSKALTGAFSALVVGLVAFVMSFSFSFAAIDASVIAALEAAGVDPAIIALISSLGDDDECVASTGYTHTVTLRSGSNGSQVAALQTALNANGAALATDGAFGPMTAAAVRVFQSANGLTADGIVGPMTGSALESGALECPEGGSEGSGSGSGSGSSSALSGGAGSIEDVDYISSYNNEEVGEDEEDVVVAGFEIEADDSSDLELTAVKLNFSQGTANRDFDKYADEVSVWFDGDEIARVDADEFNDDNNYEKTLSLDSGAIIRDGDTEDLLVAVSGISNLDSADEGETWTVELESVRFRDGQGAITTDSSTGDINDGTGRTFSFESFSTAADTELKILSGDDDVNDARLIDIDETDDTDGVDLLSFDLELEGDSDVTLDDFHIRLVAVGADVDGIVNTLHFYVDGDEIASENVPSTATTTSLILFNDVDWTLEAGERYEVLIKGDLNDENGGTFDNGDTLQLFFGEAETDNSLFDAEDEEGEDLADADKTGSEQSDAHVFYTAGPDFELVSVDETAATDDGATDDTATFTIKYNVTAVDSDLYVSDSASATIATSIAETTLGSNTVLYRVDHSGTATVAGLSAVVDFVAAGGVTDSGITNGVFVPEGETGEFTLTISRTNSTANGIAALFRAAVKGVTWATSDTATQNVYDFDLGDFETDYIFIN